MEQVTNTNEKTIISGKRRSLKKFSIGLFILGAAFAVGTIIFCLIFYYDKSYFDGSMANYKYSYLYTPARYWELVRSTTFYTVVWIPPVVIFLFVFVNFVLSSSKTSIIVTDKRIYGIARFGKRVDLPIDSVSAVGLNMFSTISVSTSSGKISFSLITNAKEIHSKISELLMARQDKPVYVSSPAPATQIINPSNAEEIKQFKELLDTGVITQEEFDAKKKQLLNI